MQLASANAIVLRPHRSAARVTGPAAVGAKPRHRRWCRGPVAPRPSTSSGAYCHTYLGEFDAARQLVDTLASAALSPPPVTDVLCPGLNSQIAFGEGALTQADVFAAGALDSSRRLGFDHHYFAFPALRTAAQLALERRHLDAAASLVEQILELVSGGRPFFEYFAQLDRARIWAAAGNLEGALSSLPAARTALRCDHSVLFAQADELEARLRLALGDARGARRVAEQLPDDRRLVISALIALGANDHRTASDILSTAPPRAPPSAPIWSCACYAPLSPSCKPRPEHPN